MAWLLSKEVMGVWARGLLGYRCPVIKLTLGLDWRNPQLGPQVALAHKSLGTLVVWLSTRGYRR